MSAGERRRRGLRSFAEVMATAAPDSTGPAVSDALIDFAFAEVWTRPVLSRRDRRFVTLACVAAADADPPLEQHSYAALSSGDISINEIREAVLHFAVYAGWPKASRFSMVVDAQWQRILGERGEPAPAPEPLLPLPTDADPEKRLQGGEQTFIDVNCMPFVPPRDDPYQGAGILNFVFGEVWQRPGLGRRERRLVTVACVAFQDAELPLLSHVYAALKSGDISFAEMDELALHFSAYYGFAKGCRLAAVIDEQQRRVQAEAGQGRD